MLKPISSLTAFVRVVEMVRLGHPDSSSSSQQLCLTIRFGGWATLWTGWPHLPAYLATRRDPKHPMSSLQLATKRLMEKVVGFARGVKDPHCHQPFAIFIVNLREGSLARSARREPLADRVRIASVCSQAAQHERGSEFRFRHISLQSSKSPSLRGTEASTLEIPVVQNAMMES